MEIVPAFETKFTKKAELSTFMLIYNPKVDSANKPDVQRRVQLLSEGRRPAGEVLQQDEPAEPERADAAAAVRLRGGPPAAERPGGAAGLVPRGRLPARNQGDRQAREQDVDPGHQFHRQPVVAATRPSPETSMRSTDQNDGVARRRRSGASVLPVPAVAQAPQLQARHARGVDGAGLDSRDGSGRARRAGRRRDGLGVRQLVGRSRSPIALDVSSCGRCRPARIWCARISAGSSRRAARSSTSGRARAASSSIALRHSPTPAQSLVVSRLLAAGIGALGRARAGAGRCDRHARRTADAVVDDDHGDIAWRLRHAAPRRS